MTKLYDGLTDRFLNSPVFTNDEFNSLFDTFKNDINNLMSGGLSGSCDDQFVEAHTFNPVKPAVFLDLNKFKEELVDNQTILNANANLLKAEQGIQSNTFIRDLRQAISDFESTAKDLNSAENFTRLAEVTRDLADNFSPGSPTRLRLDDLINTDLAIVTLATKKAAVLSRITQINSTILPHLSNFEGSISRRDAAGAMNTLTTHLLGQLVVGTPLYTSGEELFTEWLPKMNDGVTRGGTTKGSTIVDNIVKDLTFNPIESVLMSVSTIPYFQTVRSSYPFLISLDGGLNYVGKFGELVPSIAVNFKIFGRRIDFDDPLDKRNEWSLLVGLTLNGPDDLDPDYRGIFKETGSSSLLFGVGLRSPRLSRLIRFQAGVVAYKQANQNPLIDDAVVKASPYVGVSLNWDTLDFIQGLLSGKTNYDILK